MPTRTLGPSRPQKSGRDTYEGEQVFDTVAEDLMVNIRIFRVVANLALVCFIC